MGDAKGVEGVIQIINAVLAHHSKEIATVPAQGEDMIRMSGDFADECDRMSYKTRRFNFRKEVRGFHTKIHKRPN